MIFLNAKFAHLKMVRFEKNFFCVFYMSNAIGKFGVPVDLTKKSKYLPLLVNPSFNCLLHNHSLVLMAALSKISLIL